MIKELIHIHDGNLNTVRQGSEKRMTALQHWSEEDPGLRDADFDVERPSINGYYWMYYTYYYWDCDQDQAYLLIKKFKPASFLLYLPIGIFRRARYLWSIFKQIRAWWYFSLCFFLNLSEIFIIGPTYSNVIFALSMLILIAVSFTVDVLQDKVK